MRVLWLFFALWLGGTSTGLAIDTEIAFDDPARRRAPAGGEGVLPDSSVLVHKPERQTAEIEAAVMRDFAVDLGANRLQLTVDRRGVTISIPEAGSFGVGRDELSPAAQELIGREPPYPYWLPDRIDETTITESLYTAGLPDPDLVIRTGGEQRLSNFLIWQSAYAEYVFLDTLWPDFDRRHLWHACEIYASRDRRYGGAIPNPVAPNDAPR